MSAVQKFTGTGARLLSAALRSATSSGENLGAPPFRRLRQEPVRCRRPGISRLCEHYWAGRPRSRLLRAIEPGSAAVQAAFGATTAVSMPAGCRRSRNEMLPRALEKFIAAHAHGNWHCPAPGRFRQAFSWFCQAFSWFCQALGWFCQALSWWLPGNQV